MVVASRIVLIVCLGATTYLSLTPSPPSTRIGWDKIPHVLAYAALAFLLILSLRPGKTGPLAVVISLGAVLAYGVAIEFVQRVTGRSFEVADMVANAIGAVSGALLGLLARRVLMRLSTNAYGPQSR